MGGLDSQYPVENSTETAHGCGYRKGYGSKACAHEGRNMSFPFIIRRFITLFYYTVSF